MSSVQHVSTSKAAGLLADLLRERILRGELPEGTGLPAERELGGQAGVSRATVREALRILEGEGLVSTRAGRNGGSSVARPMIERSVNSFIRGQHIRFAAVLETRSAIEPAAARLAALHRTDDDLRELERCHGVLERAVGVDDVAAYLQANLDWHVQVVRASHNELLIAFISAVAQPVYEAGAFEGFDTPAVRRAVLLAHGRVMDAIRARDGDAAARRMARHVGAYVDGVQQAPPPPVRAARPRPAAAAGTRARATAGGDATR